MPNLSQALAPELKGELTRLRQQIRRQHTALEAAEIARIEAEDAARARAQFFASMSHELRTPLNAILGFAEVIEHEIFGPLGHDRYREYARIIRDSGSHLLGLVNDVLDMAKAEAGKLELYREPVDLGRLVIDSVRSVEPLVAKSRVGVAVNLHDRVHLVQADEKRLRQMLLNLLSNAIKFTCANGCVSVSVFRCGKYVAIAVSDTGIGMGTADIEKALLPYGQIDSAVSRKHQGTGLGLPLTKELAILHGGSLEIDSAVGIGTTVTILLPDAPVAAVEAVAEPELLTA